MKKKSNSKVNYSDVQDFVEKTGEWKDPHHLIPRRVRIVKSGTHYHIDVESVITPGEFQHIREDLTSLDIALKECQSLTSAEIKWN